MQYDSIIDTFIIKAYFLKLLVKGVYSVISTCLYPFKHYNNLCNSIFLLPKIFNSISELCANDHTGEKSVHRYANSCSLKKYQYLCHLYKEHGANMLYYAPPPHTKNMGASPPFPWGIRPCMYNVMSY